MRILLLTVLLTILTLTTSAEEVTTDNILTAFKLNTLRLDRTHRDPLRFEAVAHRFLVCMRD